MNTGGDKLSELKRQYDTDGFCIAPPIFPPNAVEAAREGAEAVAAGEYGTGRAPRLRELLPSEADPTLIKVAQPHYANTAIRDLIASGELGRLVEALLGARMVQVWAVDLFVKKPSSSASGSVGWHQDVACAEYWEGDIPTAWIALSEVSEESAPLHYVRGSHRLGAISGGDLYSPDLETVRRALELPDDFHWDEVPAGVPRGGVTFHHHLTLHASGPNRSALPRMALAVRLRTERSRLAPGAEHRPQVSHLDDDLDAPVIYRASSPNPPSPEAA